VEVDQGTEAALVWLTVYRRGPIDRERLLAELQIEPDALARALESLCADGRVASEASGDSRVYRAQTCVIPLDQAAGWEAALLDHYQALVGAICARLAGLGNPAVDASRIGGSTFSFDVWPGHPHSERVNALLQRTRAEMSTLWDEVHAHNSHQERPSEYQRVTFYFGQNVRVEGLPDGEQE
jgi:hypothetical protein